MNKEISRLVIPNKKINYFTFSVLILGFLCGCIFLVMLGSDDKTSVINQITNYFTQISNGSMNNGLAFKNNLIINYIYLFSIWLLGLSIIGLFFNVFIIYIKGFVVGFTISAMMLTYSVKGIISAFLYLILGQIFQLVVVLIVGIYGFMFSFHLLKLIFNKKKDNGRSMMKKYIVILGICIIITFIASSLESFVLPNVIKVIISLFVK